MGWEDNSCFICSCFVLMLTGDDDSAVSMTNVSMAEVGLDWLFLDLNSYFASVEQQDYPELRGRPVMVVPVMAHTTSAIAASYEAKAYGIKTGTPVWHARQVCPDIQIRLARHDRYVEVHHQILHEIDRHVPITQVCSIDEVACQLTGSERHPDRAVAIAQAVKDGIRRNVGVALRSSVGLAPNRFLAKVASDLQKPDGLTMIAKPALPGALLTLHLQDLPGIGRNMERRLNNAGIYSVAALWALPPKLLRQIWGSVEGERFWTDLHGLDRPIAAPPPRRSISHGHVLPPAMRSVSAARLVARRLVAKAGSRLRRFDLEASSLGISLRLLDGPKFERMVRFSPTADSLQILRLLTDTWDDLTLNLTHQRIKKVGIVLSGLEARGSGMQDLFAFADQHKRVHRTELCSAMDRLNQRYGKDTVVLGAIPDPNRQVVGAKIAFNRIPDLQEFQE